MPGLLGPNIDSKCHYDPSPSITQYYVAAVGGKSAGLDKVTGLTTTNFAHVAINSRCSQ